MLLRKIFNGYEFKTNPTELYLTLVAAKSFREIPQDGTSTPVLDDDIPFKTVERNCNKLLILRTDSIGRKVTEQRDG